MNLAKPPLALLIIINGMILTGSEIFTSTYQLTNLLSVENELNEALSTYVQEETQRLDQLRQFISLHWNSSRRNVIDNVCSSPLGVITTSRRFFKTLNVVESAVKQRSHRTEFLQRVKEYQKANMSRTDLEGANEALLRLQLVYQISPREFTNGHIGNYSVDRVNSSEPTVQSSNKINNSSRGFQPIQNQINKCWNNCCTLKEHLTKQSTNNFQVHEQIDNHSADLPFSENLPNGSFRHDYHGYDGITAMDNFRIGRHAYTSGRRKLAKAWMENVLHMMGPTGEVQDMTGKTTKQEVLNHLAYLEYQFANYNRSLEYYEEMLRYDPSDPVVRSNVERMKAKVSRREVGTPTPDDNESYDDEMLAYMEQCRQANDVISLPSKDPRLTCHYENKHPLTRFKPVAVETIGIDPRILVFRGILDDKEIDQLLALAQPKLIRAAVNNLDTGEVEEAAFRISKLAWVADHVDIAKTLDRRVAAITGLSTDTAEYLQVNNYGLGGQYEPHFDHAHELSESPIEELGVGNRIATLMFYLSDVEAGGATVFTRAGVSTKPSKGDAVFWYNLKKSGEGDERTLHAGCPVLIGNKWVANKWFHEYGNEFLRRCGMTQDE